MTMTRFLAALAAAIGLSLTAAHAAPEKAAVLSWDSLLPEDELAGAEGDDGLNTQDNIQHDLPAEQTGSSRVNDFLDGMYVRLPGFMLPLEYADNGAVTDFLLVPYFGACVHVPPPPPNQIVYVDTKDKPVKSKGMWDPIWIIGTMRTKANINGLGDTAYTLELESIEDYEE